MDTLWPPPSPPADALILPCASQFLGILWRFLVLDFMGPLLDAMKWHSVSNSIESLTFLFKLSLLDNLKMFVPQNNDRTCIFKKTQQAVNDTTRCWRETKDNLRNR